MSRTTNLLIVLSCLGGLVMGCQTAPRPQPETPSRVAKYNRPLPPGDTALRRLRNRAAFPDLAQAWKHRDALLLDAVDESARWFETPSSRRFYPFEGITHEQARAGVHVFRRLLEESPDEATFVEQFDRMFEVYQSIGADDHGTVLYTGYYSPIFPASKVRTSRFTTPLYKRPPNLVTDPITGEPRGRRTTGEAVVPYHTRRQIETSGILRGGELVWVENDLIAYIVHVNGSAKLRLPSGEIMYIGYGGKTDRPYASLGVAMVAAGLIPKGGASLQSLKRVYREQPDRVRELMYANENYVFFTEYPGANWPSGSLGVKVTAEATLATDKRVFPRGGLVLVDTKAITFSGVPRDFLRFMLDQDTGGAIQAPGRADIFMGIGGSAEILAGGQFAEGKLYYMFVKPEYVDEAETGSDRPPGRSATVARTTAGDVGAE